MISASSGIERAWDGDPVGSGAGRGANREKSRAAAKQATAESPTIDGSHRDLTGPKLAA